MSYTSKRASELSTCCFFFGGRGQKMVQYQLVISCVNLKAVLHADAIYIRNLSASFQCLVLTHMQVGGGLKSSK